ncbi:2-oxo acid dehydrogenase subunit E2 [Brevundimonas viscosa]|uniref:Dihydrolipoamide acetyltransferase component of pyruvate dehydrogenase complex n=1 Tax=Brevundimonas viscosa TaxID=871741 RepID=A0A1I6NRA5_9CAUL|nr:2-oxo acid dehydrogenase subunit E2 [Brevundimonas viscosa]SFS30532.1 branched-chain alpha-keto acid dehydrogenase E2 component [Brevundimonas viscosa]
MGRYVFKLPDVGEGTAEAELVGWHVKVGDAVAEDQIVADVMTDKATVEITSPVAGTVSRLHGEPGQMLAVRGPLVEFEVEGAGNSDDAPPSEPDAQAPVPPAGGQRAEVPPPQGEGDHAKHGGGGESASAPGANYVFKLPDVGEGTAEAELVGWRVAVGDAVEEDQILAEVMTDKATVELTSPVAGTVVALHGDEGQQIAVGGPLVSFQVEGKGNISSPLPLEGGGAGGGGGGASRQDVAREAPSKASPPASSSKQPATTPTQPSPFKGEGSRQLSDRNQRPLASPAVRQRARQLGVELQYVPGSGPAGRIEHGDLDAFLASGGRPAAPAGAGATRVRREGVEEIKVIGLRRKIAEKMQDAKRRIPHFMYAEEVDVTELEALRQHLNATNKGTDRPKLTLLPFIATALTRTLPDYPQINATYDDDAGVLYRHAGVHLGIAAQTPNGLMVPVVKNAEALDVYGLAEEIARVSSAAKAGKATREELSGSTITITSLGPLGGIVHTPVINHPEVAIVGPNKIVERVVVQDGQMVVRKMMNISSSFDHRIVDGYDAAEFIQKIKALLEHPAVLFMD